MVIKLPCVKADVRHVLHSFSLVVQVLNVPNAEPVGDNQTGEQSNLPIAALPDVDIVSTTKYVCSLLIAIGTGDIVACYNTLSTVTGPCSNCSSNYMLHVIG